MAEPEINLSDSESWPIAPRPVLSVMTPVLFGRYVATRRGSTEVSQITAYLGVSTSWWLALERGEIVPTHKQLITIERGLNRFHANTDRIPEIFAELEATPWGPRATELRRSAGLPAPTPAMNAETEASSLIPAVAEISYRSRQLVATPLAAAVVGAYLVWCLQRGPRTSPALEVPPSDLVAFLASAIAVTVVAFGASFDRLLGSLAARFRSAKARSKHDDLLRSRRLNGLDGDDRTGWSMPSALAHLTRDERVLVAALGTSLDRTERLVVIVAGMMVATTATGVVDGLGNGWSVGGVGYALAIASMAWLATRLRRKAEVEAGRIWISVAAGLGLAAEKGTDADRLLGAAG